MSNYHFDMETVEKDGRTDIRILNIKPYIDDLAYYIFECKRLDTENQNGRSGLNGEYISERIVRFVSRNILFIKKQPGMIGFVIEENEH